MGETTYVEEVISKEHMSRIQDTVSGKISEDGISDGNVYGTYIHGIFDMEGVTDVIVKALAKKKGITLEKASGMDLKSFKEEQYDKLADGIRSHLDMERIYEIMKRFRYFIKSLFPVVMVFILQIVAAIPTMLFFLFRASGDANRH